MQIDPVMFTVFGLEIRWYGFLIASGMILATIIGLKRTHRVGITQDNLLDVLIVSLPMAIVGARTYYVIFNWHSYEGDFLKMINFRNGGLAIHGGLIFAVIGALIVCKVKKINLLDILDLGFPLVALGQAIGRWGNYINQEAHGTATDLPWGILIDGVRVHPTFLYESLGDFGIFIFLSWYFGRRKEKGQVFLLYLILYGVLRFFVEGLRTDSLMIGEFRVAQLVSIGGALLGFLLFLFLQLKKKDGNRNISQ